ncbi:type-1 angiotensin II receptor A-like [Crassostrea angulata]|uniref:type-1 angiotensin II receptor A-like n=1 Tax=Magallana angulata TaxID=2784310 RepID=UPI0022B0B61D|nr:type-1 angiotensin II receptor A-like [Crassostrea angulata]
MNTTSYNLSYNYDNVTHDPEFLMNEYSVDFRFKFPTEVDIFNIISAVIAVLGVIGNIVTIVIISYRSKLKTPTFVAIKCLAVSDFFGLITVLLEHFTNAISILLTQKNIFIMLYRFILFTVQHNSPCQILLLCAVRYLLVVHPFDSRRYLTVTLVSLGSLTLWILSFVFAVIFGYLISSFYNDSILYSAIKDSVSIIQVLYLLAVVIIILSRHYYSTRRQIDTKMNLIATVMLFGFVVCRIPITVFFILTLIRRLDLFLEHMGNSYILLSIITFSYNPYILFLLTNLKYCKRKC